MTEQAAAQSAEQQNIVIGLGTGRCGTASLAALLDQQPKSRVFHEKLGFQIGWSGSWDAVDLLMRLLIARSAESRLRLVGDVAHHYLPYVDFMAQNYPQVRFVCLQRSQEETVVSWLRFLGPNRNPWTARPTRLWRNPSGQVVMASPWDRCFPKYGVPDQRQAAGLYWRTYYEAAEALSRAYPQRFRVFPMDALNTTEGQEAILQFVGVPSTQRRLAPGIRLNEGGSRRQTQPAAPGQR